MYIQSIYLVCTLYVHYKEGVMSEDKSFTFRADEDLIKVFHHACANNDTTASQAIRVFMRDYVKKHGQGDLFTTKKD